jgi:glutamate-ammonia-ligase adenylyltransferase
LIDDRQTHSIPSGAADQTYVAKTMGFDSFEEFASHLELIRADVRASYDRHLRERVVYPETAAFHPKVEAWLASTPYRDTFRAALSNLDSKERLEVIALRAPALLNLLSQEPLKFEEILTGEIEEAVEPRERFRASASVQSETFAKSIRSLWLSWALQRVLLGSPSFELASLFDIALVEWLSRRGASLQIVALGSYASSTLGFHSDADLLFLAGAHQSQPEAEQAAQVLIADIKSLALYGSPLRIDLRLRPDGGKGLLARSHDALAAYSKDGMEIWERFALGKCRLVAGQMESLETVLDAAYALPLTRARLEELLHMKHRIETERVAPQHATRQVKLGEGGLDDIEWLVQLTFLAERERLPGHEPGIRARLQAMVEEGLMSEPNATALLAARDHFDSVRFWIAMLGFEEDVLPENPAKLDNLGWNLGFERGQEFLAAHEKVRVTVRNLIVHQIAMLEDTR